MSGKEFFERRLAALSAGDIDSLVADYADDAEVVRFLGVPADQTRSGRISLVFLPRTVDST